VYSPNLSEVERGEICSCAAFTEGIPMGEAKMTRSASRTLSGRWSSHFNFALYTNKFLDE